jgi:hypothetical protein
LTRSTKIVPLSFEPGSNATNLCNTQRTAAAAAAAAAAHARTHARAHARTRADGRCARSRLHGLARDVLVLGRRRELLPCDRLADLCATAP